MRGGGPQGGRARGLGEGPPVGDWAERERRRGGRAGAWGARSSWSRGGGPPWAVGDGGHGAEGHGARGRGGWGKGPRRGPSVGEGGLGGRLTRGGVRLSRVAGGGRQGDGAVPPHADLRGRAHPAAGLAAAGVRGAQGAAALVAHSPRLLLVDGLIVEPQDFLQAQRVLRARGRPGVRRPLAALRAGRLSHPVGRAALRAPRLLSCRAYSPRTAAAASSPEPRPAGRARRRGDGGGRGGDQAGYGP